MYLSAIKHFYLYLTLSSALSWTAGLPSLLHSFDSVAHGAHAERHLRTVRLSTCLDIKMAKIWESLWWLIIDLYLNLYFTFCCQIENCVPLILVIFLLEQNTKCRRVLVHVQGLFLPFWCDWNCDPSGATRSVSRLATEREQCGMAKPRKEEQLLKSTSGDTFTLTSWQFKFQLY